MSEHARRTMERHTDVAVIGGTSDGLAIAEALGRAGRRTIVVDARVLDELAAEREAVRRHGSEVLAGRATTVDRGHDGSLRVRLVGGHALVARRAVIATDADDERPAIDGHAGDVVDLFDATDPAGAADVHACAATLVAGLDAEDATAPPPSANQADWDARYSGEQMWSGNPNGTLVAEAAGLAPGRALDVGAGEGADALWLAEQGWSVTAADISARALDRLAGEAARRGLQVTSLTVDANEPGALGSGRFDLVCALYASIPRTPDDRAVRNLLDAVAPGGTLLVVGHDLTPMRAPVDTTEHSRAFDADAYVRVADVAAAVADDPGWTVEVHELRPRPAGAVTTHHVDDEVLRARRR